MQPLEWIKFYEQLERVASGHRTRVWYQPTYAHRDRVAGYAADGYRGCIGRTLDRISIFPDGRACQANACLQQLIKRQILPEAHAVRSVR